MTFALVSGQLPQNESPPSCKIYYPTYLLLESREEISDECPAIDPVCPGNCPAYFGG